MKTLPTRLLLSVFKKPQESEISATESGRINNKYSLVPSSVNHQALLSLAGVIMAPTRVTFQLDALLFSWWPSLVLCCQAGFGTA